MKKNRPTWWALLVLGLAGAAGLASTSGTYVEAADHLDPPMRTSPDTAHGGVGATADRHADIADIYAWHTGSGATGTVTTVLSFSGPNPAAAADAQAIPCDDHVVYQIHISNDAPPPAGDLDAEFVIEARFATDSESNCFLRVTGAPGMTTGSEIVSPVEYNGRLTVPSGVVRTHAGLHDDHFFFDLEGFRTTLMTGSLAFENDRDFFATQNTPAIVVEFPLLAVSPANERLRIWAVTTRIP